MINWNSLWSIVVLSSIVCADPFWVVRHGTLVESRLDPIIAPGVVSGHTHAIVGTGSFDPNYSYENSRNSDCTTANVDVDFSSYWVPALYAQWPNGTFTKQKFRGANTYYQVRRGTNEPIYEFPPGFRMVAGDPYRTTFDASVLAQDAVRYNCLGVTGPETNKFPAQYCPDGLRAEVYFPHCWDGVNNWLDGSAHVSYGAEGTFDGGGRCPDTHPKRIMGLFYEFLFDDVKPETGAKRTLATGDQTGYGFHGDFTNGWPTGLFSKIWAEGETCNVGFSLENCPPLKEVMTDISDCKYDGLIVDEEIGYTPLDALPGNNPVFDAENPRQPDLNYVEKAQFVRAVNGMPGPGPETPPPAMVSPTQVDSGDR
ncbi:hypothetical protein BD324DRAFT_301880 [Kockovaella imperatae]|uniref:DUF1996 domain-containing protein n=1 Tax=Kockovaella imperatae TaxID=4999 RepID=A0A1Y1ULV5_9TREE|nr:hypothetical protein BD324DRAFT_301880 [Kockovaella imperatae]ORX38972.1 hypothetical protein BD324DRAFT_301880 [Kockovaella imperatae]